MTDAREGHAYEHFQRGLSLLDGGDYHAASVALERARALEPAKASIREALARAYFNSRRFDRARREFARTVALSPSDDYAHFGLGLCLLRLGDREAGRGHLRLAVAMNPAPAHYHRALRQAEAA